MNIIINNKKRVKRIILDISICVLITMAAILVQNEKAYAKTLKTTYGGVVYKVISEEDYTVEVISVSKGLDEVEIESSVVMICDNVIYGDYQVVSIAKNAFKGRNKIKSIILPETIKTIGKNAFDGIDKNAQFTVPYGYLNSMKKLIKRKEVGWKNSMKLVQSKPDESVKNIKRYKYSIKPIVKGVCDYFYVQTDNPNPDSFVIVDDNTKLSDKSVVISNCEEIFADVKYTNKKKYRVNGGYIFKGYDVDGGNLKVMSKTDYFYRTEYFYTGIKVKCQKLQSMEEYLIDTYTNKKMTFFEKMDAVQSGLNDICLYSGAYILGDLKKSKESPYYGLSTSPHVDQDFYIQDPYYRTDSKSMLLSRLYPYILDSLGFPSEMSAVAKKIDSKAQCKWNESAHYLMDITYNGEKRTYGGAGYGGGQGIESDMLKHKYKFDGSGSDFAKKDSWSDLKKKICYYGSLDVDDGIPKTGVLTWKKVANKVGEGSYVRLVLITSIFGGGGIGYSYLYEDDDVYRGVNYMYDCWYDGRYFNKWEFFEKGTKFSEHPTSDIVIKDYVAKLPNNGNIYYYNGSKEAFNKKYDKKTGVWKGYTTFSYNSKTKYWESEILDRITYRKADSIEYNYDSYKKITNESVISRFELTESKVKKMKVDKNANKEPKDFYIYDMESKPGTKGKN